MWLLEVIKIAIPSTVTYLLGRWQGKKTRETLIESKSPRLKLRAVESVKRDENGRIKLCKIEFKVQNVGFGSAFNIDIFDCRRANKEYKTMQGQPSSLTLLPGAPEQNYPFVFCSSDLSNEDLKANLLFVNTKCTGVFNNEIEQKFESIHLWDGGAGTYSFDLRETCSHVGTAKS